MKKFFFLFIILSSSLYSEPLIQTDVIPDHRIKNIKSLALFRFDAKLVNSGRMGLVNYLEISDKFYRYLLELFYIAQKFEIVGAEEKLSQTESDALSTLRSDDVPAYDQKQLGYKEEISQQPVKVLDAFLYGKINKFYEGDSFDTSYIDITLFLVESKSKVMLWTSGVRGCLKYVARTVVDTVVTGDLSEPAARDLKEFKWVNPYSTLRGYQGLGYGLGYLMAVGPLSKRVQNGLVHHLFFDFRFMSRSIPQLINQIELMVIPSLRSADNNDPLRDYTYRTYLPLLFNFIYYFNASSFSPYVRLGLGASFQQTYYSGLGVEKPSVLALYTIADFSVGLKYDIKFNRFYLFGSQIRLNAIGLLLQADFYHWFISEYSAHAVDFNLGLKYYF